MNRELACVMAAMAMAGGAMAQDAVQWRIEDGGNGHWYALLPVPQTWQQARQWCEDHGGHLATVTTLTESALVSSISLTPHTWLGGFQDALADDFSEPAGGWRWITGEPWTFTVWNAAEPNNYPPGQENWLATHNNQQSWADLPSAWTLPFVVEFEADCDGDGVVDFGQIRDGSLADANANNIPDCCEAGQSCAPCPADIVQDNAVNGVDLAAVINAWGTDGGKLPRSDVDGNGIVDGADLAQVLGAWGPCN